MVHDCARKPGRHVFPQVLAELAVRPGSAATLVRLTWAMGRGLGEHLLQLQQWALQVHHLGKLLHDALASPSAFFESGDFT